MADVNDTATAEKHVDKHNTVDARPPSTGGLDIVGSSQPPPVRPLIRADSRTGLVPQSLRQVAPSQVQPRPQFVPGGPVTGPPAFRPGAPTLRGPVPAGAPQQIRPTPPPLRPFGPQSIAPQQGPRPQSPTVRAPPPNSLQFGPRQPLATSNLTPEGSRPQVGQTNGIYKNGVQLGSDQLPRQPSQGTLKGLDTNYQNKPANLENQSEIKNDNQNGSKAENGIEAPGMAKGRSYSIAAAPGAPSPLKAEDDRRKSVSAIGGRIEEFAIRSPGLGLIQEGKTDSKDNIRESKESLPSEANEAAKDIPDRPDSRLSGSKMTESFIGALPNVTPAKKVDDDDDVILQNNQANMKNISEPPKAQAKEDLSDRSPSLTRSDDSPEPKQITVTAAIPNKSQNGTPEPRPKTPKSENGKTEIKSDVKSDITKEAKLAATPNKTVSKSPVPDAKPTTPVGTKKPNELNMSITSDSKKSTPRKAASAPKARPKDGDNDSGVDESTQGNDMNGSPGSPNKKLPSKLPTKEKSSNSLKTSLSRSSSKSATAKTPENPPPAEKKKVPMNKVQVGNAPSPNLKAVKSKIGSLDNAAYKPGGGKVKIENRKLEFGNITPKIAAKNDAYTPSGGSKKILTTKLEWNAKPKVGSLQNAAYKPGGGDKKIETVKLDFSEKAKPKVGSTANITHKPGGGAIKIENQKLEFKAQSKVGSLDNVKHKPGGGEIKIFEDKEYIKQMTGQSPVPTSRSHSRQEDEYISPEREWIEERPKSRCRSARTPRTPRALSPRRKVYGVEDDVIQRNNERNRRSSRPASAREPPRSACSRRASLTKRPAFTIY